MAWERKITRQVRTVAETAIKQGIARADYVPYVQE
jgi:hypothetical protein